MNLSTVKWAQWDKTQCRELLVLFIGVCSSLCTIVAHNTPQNRPDNFPSCHPENHHCSDDVYLRERGGWGHEETRDHKNKQVVSNTIQTLFTTESQRSQSYHWQWRLEIKGDSPNAFHHLSDRYFPSPNPDMERNLSGSFWTLEPRRNKTGIPSP